MKIHTITHKHAHIYLIGDVRYVMYDCGWQDSFPAIKSALRDLGITFQEIHGVFVSHFHPDHAGTLELLRRHGVAPLILERQIPCIPWLNDFFTREKNDPHGRYAPFDAAAIHPISPDQAQGYLADCGIDGTILYTNGHSEDGITLVAGDAAFTGDLPPYELAENSPQLADNWRDIIACNVKTVYPAHGIITEIA